MRKLPQKPTFSLAGILCGTLGHNYVITNKITDQISEYQCTNCKKEVTTNYKGHFETLTFKNREVNATLASFLEKKRRRKLAV